MKSRALLAAAAVLATAAVAGGCSAEPAHQFDPAATTIVYEFTDSSVPPEYHRSFTLTVEGGIGTIVVGTYDEETARDEQEVSSAVVEDLVAAYNAGDLADVFDVKLPDDNGCGGGQTFELTFDDGSEEASTTIYRCSDESEEPALALAAVADPLLDPFDIDTLTEGRYRL